MKKITAMICACALLLSCGISAFAEEGAGLPIEPTSAGISAEALSAQTETGLIPRQADRDKDTEGAEYTEQEEYTEDQDDNIADSVGALLETAEHNAYIGGYKDGTFRPNGKITRAETATMFYNLLKEKPEAVLFFDDVKSSDWFADEVGALAALGVLKGRTDELFVPGASIKRGEFAAIAARFSRIMTGINEFDDVDDDAWYTKYVISAHAYGWIDGYPDGTFLPEEPIKRSEAVKVINAMLGRKGDDKIMDISSVTRFPDVTKNHWAYKHICEAATSHAYRRENGMEIWEVPENDIHTWEQDEDGAYRYYNESQDAYAAGFMHIGGLTYYFDPETNILLTGWQEINGNHYLLPEKDEDPFGFSIGEFLTLINYRDAERDWQDIKYITVHYTAEPGDTAYGECQAFYTTYRAASAHYFVDESSVWQSVLDEDIAWHVGNNIYYHDEARNENTIGIEMCCRKGNPSNKSSPYDDDWYFLEETKNNTVALIQGLMKKYAVPVESLIRHSDVTQKECPAPFINDDTEWKDFINRVTGYSVPYDGSYRARITENNVKVYAGPNTTYSVVGTLSKGTVRTVYEETVTLPRRDGRWARIGINEWVNLPYISRLPAE